MTTGHHALNATIRVTRPTGFSVDIQLNVPAGQTVALLGPNGAGKSTIVSALAGLEPLTAGSVSLGARVLEDATNKTYVPPSERHIGIVFQDALLFPHLNVHDNIAFGLRSRKAPPTQVAARVQEWITRLDLGQLAHRRPAQLSGGEAQRVAIARAFVTEPALLILDEPLAAIDASTRPRVRRILSEYLAAFTGPAIVITHDPAEAFLLADRVVIVENGTVTHDGNAESVRLAPSTQYAADLAGVNLAVGHATDGVITVQLHELHVADTTITGPTMVNIHPRAIMLHRHKPEGSARNVWETTVERMEHHGQTVRVATGAPLPLAAEVTAAGAADMGLAVGQRVWLSIKATEIYTVPK